MRSDAAKRLSMDRLSFCRKQARAGRSHRTNRPSSRRRLSQRTAQGEGPTVSLHNQIAESDRHAARVFSRRQCKATGTAQWGNRLRQERAVTPPPRLVEAQQATPMAARVTPPSLLFTGPQGRPGDAAGTTSPEPPVHVTIGRIEVTALPAPSPPGRKSAARPPSMSLADYLARRQGRGA
jgi:hypothetical protein